MSVARITRRLGAGLALAAALSAFQAAVSAGSSLSVNDREVRVIVPLEVHDGDDGLVSRWSDAIDREWNHGNGGEPFEYCGRTVTFVPVFQEPPSGDRGDDANAHLLQVMEPRPGQYFVSHVSFPTGTSPVDTSRWGFITWSASDETVAHEFGHYLGLPDEYIEHDANGNGIRDPGEATTPNSALYPDAESSLMGARGGHVLARHVDAALEAHGIADQLQCSLEVRVKGVYSAMPEIAQCNGDRATIQADVALTVQNMDADGDGPMTVAWRPINRCPNTLFGGYRPAPDSHPSLHLETRWRIDTGYTVTVRTTAIFESHLIDGRVVATGDFLRQWPALINGVDVAGTLASFQVPTNDWKVGKIFRFENREGTLTPGADMRLFGSATLELCRTSSDGPFAGCH
jgi:hypothetical protein